MKRTKLMLAYHVIHSPLWRGEYISPEKLAKRLTKPELQEMYDRKMRHFEKWPVKK